MNILNLFLLKILLNLGLTINQIEEKLDEDPDCLICIK